MDGNKINTGIFVPPMNAAELVRYLKIVQKINENVKERIVPLIIGHTGVGKSQIIEQISNELNIDFNFHTADAFYETNDYAHGKTKYFRGHCLQKLCDLHKTKSSKILKK